MSQGRGRCHWGAAGSHAADKIASTLLLSPLDDGHVDLKGEETSRL